MKIRYTATCFLRLTNDKISDDGPIPMCSRVISGNAATPSRSDMMSLSTSQLRPGARLQFPVVDARNILLLAAGTNITPHVIETLNRRGITTIKVHRSDAGNISRQPAEAGRGLAGRSGHLEAAPARRLDSELDASRLLPEPPAKAFSAEIIRHGTAPYDPGLASQMIEGHRESQNQIDQLFKSLEDADDIDADAVEGVSARSLGQLAGDLDLFVSLGITLESDRYPSQHSMRSSMLAMAVGTQMDLDERSLLDLSTGCLVHDIGMLRIDHEIYQRPSAIDPLAMLEITKHPSLTFDLIREVEGISGPARLVAYQVHERCDGSGYPRGRKANQIHPLAKIASVADVFMALISPRPHRPGRMPYYAVEHLIRGAKKGLFDPQAVRGLLQTVSLFPIGSYVELKDGRPGRVIRSNGDAYTSPIIEAWDPGRLNMQPTVIDLANETEIQIQRPLASLSGETEEPPMDWD